MATTHRSVLKGTSYICLDCGAFLRDVRTGAQLRQLRTASDDDIKVKLAAVERRYMLEPELAKRLASEDLYQVISTYKLADKFNDFLMNPQARPDLQKPEAQSFLQTLQGGGYVNDKTDPLTPWLTREWKKGRIQPHPQDASRLQFNAGPDYEYELPEGAGTTPWHSLAPDQLNHWADWYRSDHPSRQGQDIMQMQAPQLHQTIKDWDTDMRDKAQGAAQTRGDVEHSYPDGWNVQRLNSAQALKDEGEKMGHCVGGYWPGVQSGQTQIYSLRDHQNEPHATWEVTPRWHEAPDGQLYNVADPEIGTTPTQRDGTIEQIQGKANEPPIPEYQKRIKDYYETKFPDPEDRPKWEDQHIDDMDDVTDNGDYTAYHPGEYGLNKPAQTYDWPKIVDNLSPIGYSYSHPEDAVDHAVEAGQLGALESAANNWSQEAEEDHRNGFDWDYQHYPEDYVPPYNELEPQPEDFEDAAEGAPPWSSDDYNEAWEKWDKEREEYLEAHQDDARREDWYNSDEGLKAGEWDDAIQQAKLRQRRQQNQSHIAKARSPHQHWSTGQWCNCTFTKHLPPRTGAWSENAGPGRCEVCGDPLEHAQCKRCDWGNWVKHPETENPLDPTRDYHGIQARWREASPA